MKINLNKFKERALTIDAIGLLYILVVGSLCYILPIPEIVKGFFAVPASFFFYYLLGSTFYFIVVLKLFKKDLLELKRRDIFSNVIFLFFLGFIIWIFIINFLNFLNFILFRFLNIIFVQEYIMRFILIYLFIFIFTVNIFWINYTGARINELRSLFIRNKVVIIIFILLSIGLFLIANYHIPVGSLRFGFASPSDQYYSVTQWIDSGYYINSRIFESSLVYIGTFFFNLELNTTNPLIYSWMAPFFVMLLALIGIYLWVYILTNNKVFSVIAIIMGGLCFGTTVEAGNSILITFKGNYIFPVVLLFLFFFVHKNMETKEKLQKNIFLPFLVLCLVLFIIGMWLTYVRVDPLVGFFRRFMFTVLILLFAFLLLKSHYKEKINLILIIFLFSSLFFHASEFPFFVGIILLYYMLLKINFEEKSKTFYFVIIGIIFLNLITIYFLLNNTSNFHFNFDPSGSYASEYSINWKIDALRYYFVDNDIVFGTIILGYISLLVYQLTNFKKKYLPIIGVFAFCMFIYFFPEGLTYRIEKFIKPFFVFMIVFFLYQVKEFYKRRYSANQFYKGFILVLMFLAIFYISFYLFDPFYNQSKVYSNLPTKTIFANYEYTACTWMRTNLSENTVILSDWMTNFGMTLLCKKSTFIRPDMSNLLTSPPDGRDKWLIVKNEIFGANNSEEAYRGIKKLSKMPDEGLLPEYYVETMSLKNPEFAKPQFVIVLTDRTINWLDSDCPKGYIIPPMKLLYSLEKIDLNSKYVQLFENNAYFNLIYNDGDYIHIYAVSQMEEN